MKTVKPLNVNFHMLYVFNVCAPMDAYLVRLSILNSYMVIQAFNLDPRAPFPSEGKSALGSRLTGFISS